MNQDVIALVFAMAGPVVLLVAVWRAVAAAVRLRLGVRSRGWPLVPGVVTRAELRSAVIKARTRRVVHYPHVEFEYAAGGATHVGRTFAVRRLDHRREEAVRRVLADFQVGSDVSVAVDTRRPNRAVLIVGPQGRDSLQLFEALFIAALGAVLTGVGVMLGGGWRALVHSAAQWFG